jgi:flagella basal body P-ring formation protein FlgA
MRKILIIVFLLLLSQQIYAAAPKITVIVRSGTEVAGTTVILSDIASVKSNDKSLTEKLKHTEVCASPLPGKMRKLARAQVMTSLRKTGIDDKDISLLCPESLSITRSSMEITGQALFDAAKDYAMSAHNLPGTVYIEPVRLLPTQQLPVGKIELKAQPINSIRKGQNSIAVDIVLDGKTERRIYVPILVKTLTKVLIATKPISKNEELTSDNTALEDRDITTMPYEAYTGELDNGTQASMPIAQGAVIRKQWICEPVMVHSGDNVIVVVQSGGVRISDKGTAAEDGHAGQLIKIRFSDGKREIRATVIEPGVVQISTGGRN